MWSTNFTALFATGSTTSFSFAHNKTYHRIGENDPRMFVIICTQHEVEIWLKLVSFLFEGTNTCLILDDCAASKYVKWRTGQLVELAFFARHSGISVWMLTQKITSITPSFRENVAVIVLFYTPSAKTTNAIFDDYGGELSQEERRGLIAKLKKRKFSYIVFSLRYPYGTHFMWFLLKKTKHRGVSLPLYPLLI